jgi:pilus assembly protein CpaF
MREVYEAYQESLLGELRRLGEHGEVTEILVNGPDEIFLERGGRLEPANMGFPGGLWRLTALTRNIAEWVGRPLSPEEPMLDARLADGSRVSIVIPPCSDRVYLSLRPIRRIEIGLDDLVGRRALTPEAAEFLGLAVRLGLNVVVAGATGAGKSTLLNALVRRIPPAERIVVIEDTRELMPSQPHVVSLEARPGGAGGRPIAIRDLFVMSLRMRPDRIVVGEVRRGEALDVVQAMVSGHSGVMTTVHADSPRSALLRLETLCQMADVKLPVESLRRLLGAVHLVVQVRRDDDGRRRVGRIAEVIPSRAGCRLRSLYKTRHDEAGPSLEPTGARCRFGDRLAALPPEERPVLSAAVFGPDR